ncbi:23S rRNA (uracil(1939)-C(5))-methyltransferase RlmD [Salinisphaera aquimarina]|uniref:23S rRNA (uracil(1939)-C(5))-methyltransferase RlmD n=1 Tax=Salinisphaera aquimarina TaxID=2094031 RepID=A0ABV7ESJ9_9GAMM
MSRRQRRRQPAERGIVDIEDLASNARGVGHVDGKAVFVADTLPGERALYRPTRRKRGFDEASLETLFSTSPRRVTPKCAHFGVCGGCALQHADADAQLEFKQNQLLSALTRVGKVEAEQILAPLIDARWGYRRRARLGVKYVEKKGGTLVGFRERGAPFIALLRRCEVLVDSVGSRLVALAQMIDGLSIRERLPQIEVAAADNVVALVFRVLDPPNAADRDLLAAFAREHDFSIYLQPGNEQTIVPLGADAPALYYDLPAYDARLYFQPNDFVQIHAGINARMIDQALALLDVQSSETVLELFSGLGNFSIPLSRSARRVITVEGEASLVERAKANARSNGADNIEAHVANLFEPEAQPAWLDQPIDKILIDPPRSGAAEILPQIAASGASRIVYCSCHPATLARDAQMLVHQYGYRLTHAGVMDMFPHTAHIESMAVFERGER